jgi:hypothetical protein
MTNCAAMDNRTTLPPIQFRKKGKYEEVYRSLAK